MWAEERVRVSPEIASDIALVPMIVLIGQIVTGILFALGIIMICWYPTKFATHICQDPKGKNVLLRSFSNRGAVAVNIVPPRNNKERVSLLDHNGGISLLRAKSSITEGLLSNSSSTNTSTDVISSKT